jgi:hypothetical protein
MKLLIVETPAQAKMVSSLLESDWRVEAYGETAIDFPKQELGIDLKRGFYPTYTVQQPRRVKHMISAISQADSVHIAVAPTLEAESRVWRLLKFAQVPSDKPVMRVLLRGLTRDAIFAALESPHALDTKRIEAAETLNAAERLTGYLLTPLIRKTLSSFKGIGYLDGLAFQQIALKPSQPAARWSLRATFETARGKQFSAGMVTQDDRRVELSDQAKGDKLLKMMASAICWISDTADSQQEQARVLPYVLSNLIADSGFSPAHTLALAMVLYERGFITCPLIHDAYLLPTDQICTLDGESGQLYALISNRALETDHSQITQRTRDITIRVWWERDQSVWLSFRATEIEDELGAIDDLETLRFVSGELIPVNSVNSQNDIAIINTLYKSGAADIPASISAVTSLVELGYIKPDDYMRVSETGERLRDWLDTVCPNLFALKDAILLSQIEAGKQSRLDALTVFWEQLKLAFPQPQVTDIRPIVLHSLET